MITRRIIIVVVAVVLAAFTGSGRADTVFEDGLVNQVSSPLDFGDVFVRDSGGGAATTLSLLPGGSASGLVTGVSVEDASVLNVSGGTVEGFDFGIKALDSSLVEMTGGTVSGMIGIAALGSV